jgi:desulfoferrodoxin (superoxide reductase-like protein)
VLIGKLLLLTQDTEHHISWALRVVFKDGLITAEDFVRKDKKTLGQLVRTIRENLQVEKSF